MTEAPFQPGDRVQHTFWVAEIEIVDICYKKPGEPIEMDQWVFRAKSGAGGLCRLYKRL